jgi:hypothetical protein
MRWAKYAASMGNMIIHMQFDVGILKRPLRIHRHRRDDIINLDLIRNNKTERSGFHWLRNVCGGAFLKRRQ